MRYYLVLILTLILNLSFKASGQSLLWQQRYSWPDKDILSGVVSLDDGSYLAAGMRNTYTEDGTSLTSPAIALLRVNEFGDTLYIKSLPMYSYYNSIRLCRMRSGAVYIAGMYISFGGVSFRTMLGRVNPENGTLYWSHSLARVGPFGYSYVPNHLAEAPDNTLIIAGSCDDPLGQANSIGYLASYDTSGNFRWGNEYREHPTFTLCNHVEQTTEGKLLVSGTAGSRIWAAELTADSGREIRRATFYQNIPRINFDYENAWVQQAPGNRYVVAGSIQTSPNTTSYFGLHQGWAGPKLWGGETRGPLTIPPVNQDGSIIYFNHTTVMLLRLRADSSVMWRSGPFIPLGGRGIQFTSFAYLSDTSAIGVGIASYRDSTQQDWYVARITNMGIPYDPSTVVSVAKQVEVKPYAYPTPCRESLGFSGLRSPAKLELLDVQGRIVLTTEIITDRMVDVSALAPGLYQYRLSSVGRVYSGRVMKE